MQMLCAAKLIRWGIRQWWKILTPCDSFVNDMEPKTPNEIKSSFQVRKHVYHDADNLDTAFDAGGELFG